MAKLQYNLKQKIGGIAVKKIRTIIALCMVGMVLFLDIPVSAASPEADVCASNVIKIDAEEVTEDTGKTLAEVLGNFDTRATSMPKDTWDWSDGTYSSSFEIDYEVCYTRYNFTGYSTLYVVTEAERDKYTPASDVYYLYVLTGSGQGTIQTSIELNTTDLVHMEISNLKPDKKYAFAIVKANDGSRLTGTISVLN